MRPPPFPLYTPPKLFTRRRPLPGRPPPKSARLPHPPPLPLLDSLRNICRIRPRLPPPCQSRIGKSGRARLPNPALTAEVDLASSATSAPSYLAHESSLPRPPIYVLPLALFPTVAAPSARRTPRDVKGWLDVVTKAEAAAERDAVAMAVGHWKRKQLWGYSS